MLKYLGAAIFAIGLATIYQNCDGGIQGFNDKSSSAGSLNLRFDYSLQYVTLTASSMIIEGQCYVSGYVDHRFDWEYTFNGQIYRGRTDRPCSTPNNRFMLSISISHLTRTENSELNFTASATGFRKGGASTRGSSSSTKIVFSSSASTGTTTGGSTGGTSGGTTGSCTNSFCATCPEEAAAGLTEYCSGDPNYAAYCASITYPPDMSEVVYQVAAEFPDKLANCARNAAENPQWNAFTTEVVSRLRTYDLRWGFNGVRGNTNDINGDTISWWGAPGAAQEGQVGNVILDIVIACGAGGSNTPAWQVLGPAYCGCCTQFARWTLGPLK